MVFGNTLYIQKPKYVKNNQLINKIITNSINNILTNQHCNDIIIYKVGIEA